MNEKLTRFIMSAVDIDPNNFEKIVDTIENFNYLTLEELTTVLYLLRDDSNILLLVNGDNLMFQSLREFLCKCITAHPNADSNLILKTLEQVSSLPNEQLRVSLSKSMLYWVIKYPEQVKHIEFFSELRNSGKVNEELLLNILKNENMNSAILQGLLYDNFMLEQFVIQGGHKFIKVLKQLNSDRLLQSDNREAHNISIQIYETIKSINEALTSLLITFSNTTMTNNSSIFSLPEGPIQNVVQYLYGKDINLYLPSRPINSQQTKFQYTDVSFTEHGNNVKNSIDRVKLNRLGIV